MILPMIIDAPPTQSVRAPGFTGAMVWTSTENNEIYPKRQGIVAIGTNGWRRIRNRGNRYTEFRPWDIRPKHRYITMDEAKMMWYF